MGAISGGLEEDPGTMYPTQIRDRNGNFVRIRYQTGNSAIYAESSARITQIEDVRAATDAATYTFTYNSDTPVPHLTGISNSINTAETFTFYSTAATAYAPFSPQVSFGNAQMLQSITQTGTSLSHSFEYGSNGAGELTKVIFPYQGELRWTYADFNFSGSRTIREVSEERLGDAMGGFERAAG